MTHLFAGIGATLLFSYAKATFTPVWWLYALIWWGMFSSEKSIPLRIYTWNLVILTFPWIPVIGAVIIQKWKSQKGGSIP